MECHAARTWLHMTDSAQSGSAAARAATSSWWCARLRRSLAHHPELVSALTARDPDWAESVMCSHVRAAWHTLRSSATAPGDRT